MLKIVGVMTGTSCDSLDAACIGIDPSGWEPLWSASIPYPPQLRKRVLDFQNPKSVHSSADWLDLNRDLGGWYGRSLAAILKKKGDSADVIANHGQTLAHFPDRGSTLQMGDPARIAVATGLTVVSNFREGDMAAGGQGAPLVPLFHSMLAEHLDPGNQRGIAIHNIGGISNLTYIGQDGQILAFDTGPGNIWIDRAVELATHGKSKMDTGGRIASGGVPDSKALERILKHPYFSKAVPKSTGRDEFPFDYFKSRTSAKGPALVATATAVTVESIARAYERFILKKRFPLGEIYLCGGGALNSFLAKSLQLRLPEIEIKPLNGSGLDAKLIEAQAFAFFGFLALAGKPLGGSWTGARSFGPPAHVIPGENWGSVLEKILAFHQAS